MIQADESPCPVLNRHNLTQARELEAFALPVLKEVGYSSGFFVNQIRGRMKGLTKNRNYKVGHAGTLDPFAQGVLLVLCGKATKLQSQFMAAAKTYEALVCFGRTTPSLDPETEVSAIDEGFVLNETELRAVLGDFRGTIRQVPPSYSAVQVDGKRAYKLARQGVALELLAKEVRVDALEVLGVEGNNARLRMTTGSGFYVRSLAHDLAVSLGTLGFLTELVRTESAGVRLEDCLKLREVLDGV